MKRKVIKRATTVLPVGISPQTESLTFKNIYQAFAKTNYGYILKHRIRWSMFKPTEYSDAEWQKVLGKDANNLEHLLIAYRQTRDFLKLDPEFSLSETQLLLLTSIVHDWAEPAVGDIMRYIKKEEDDKREIKLLRNVLHEVLGGRLDSETINAVCRILQDKRSRLGFAFNTIETIGYFETAIRAWEQSKKVNGDLRGRLKWLTSNVLLIDINKLMERADRFHSVKLFIKKHKKVFDEAFDQMPDTVFEFHRHDKKDYYREKFASQKKAWLQYCKNLPK